MRQLENALAFTHKWGCITAHTALRPLLLNDPDDKRMAFALAAHYNDVSVARSLLRQYITYTWTVESTVVPWINGAETGWSIFDPAVLPINYAELIPPKWLWAMARFAALGKTEKDVEKRIDAFKKSLEVWDKDQEKRRTEKSEPPRLSSFLLRSSADSLSKRSNPQHLHTILAESPICKPSTMHETASASRTRCSPPLDPSSQSPTPSYNERL